VSENTIQFRNLLLFLLLKTMKKIGLTPELLFRQASEAVTEDINYISKTFFKGGTINKSQFEVMVDNILATLKDANVISNYELEFEGENVINIKCEGCSYLTMAEEAKRHGEKGCPICLVAFAGSVACTAVAGYMFNKVNYEVYEPGKCRIRFEYEH